MARVSPIFKKGKKNDPNNYRPISIVPAVPKIFGKVIFEQFYNYFSINRLLTHCHRDSGHYILHLLLSSKPLHGKKRRSRCSTGLNNVLLPTLFTLINMTTTLNNIVEPESCVTILFNIVDNREQCGQQNIVQSCFHHYCNNLSVFTRVVTGQSIQTAAFSIFEIIICNIDR